jgi:hypothetical protein
MALEASASGKQILAIPLHSPLQLSRCLFALWLQFSDGTKKSHWSYGSSIFSFLRNLHTAFHTGCTNLHSHQQWISISVSAHSCQHLLLLPLIMPILTGVKWNVSIVWICISFIMKKVEHFMYLLAICTSFLWEFPV